jgi:hypothetical protein
MEAGQEDVANAIKRTGPFKPRVLKKYVPNLARTCKKGIVISLCPRHAFPMLGPTFRPSMRCRPSSCCRAQLTPCLASLVLVCRASRRVLQVLNAMASLDLVWTDLTPANLVLVNQDVKVCTSQYIYTL